eukprot:c25293_g1_i2 orf=262-642(+)
MSCIRHNAGHLYHSYNWALQKHFVNGDICIHTFQPSTLTNHSDHNKHQHTPQNKVAASNKHLNKPYPLTNTWQGASVSDSYMESLILLKSKSLKVFLLSTVPFTLELEVISAHYPSHEGNAPQCHS